VQLIAWAVTLTESGGEYSAPTSVLAAIAPIAKIPLKLDRSTWDSQSSRIEPKLLKTNSGTQFCAVLGSTSPNLPKFRPHPTW
jgi:hypothetical protein